MAGTTKTPRFPPSRGRGSPPKPTPRRTVVVVAFDGVEPLDVVGPTSVFAKATEARAGAYEVIVATPRGGAIQTCGGVALAGTIALGEVPPRVDTLLVAGGDAAALAGAIAAGVPAWLAKRRKARRIGSICTGAFLLAAAGLLDGRRATTHWRAADRLKAMFPRVIVDPDPIYLHDGVYTSAGITAGIDLALALVAADHGQAVANAIARDLVVYARRAGGQSQYSRALAAQANGAGRLAAVATWILDHLEAPLAVPDLAARAGMTERTFARRFKAETGMTPAQFVLRARVDRALMLLETTAAPIEHVAGSVGLGSIDALQRAFKAFGLGAPSAHRRHFGGGG